MQYIIYMDESGKEGRYYGNFYGGALVRSHDFERVVEGISKKKQELNLFQEVKWQRVTSQYLAKYIELMDYFFDFVETDIVKIRVMFTQNYRRPINLTRDQLDNTFTQLYYQFFKHAFGLPYSNPSENPISLRLYFDELPIHKDKAAAFKQFIINLGTSEEFSGAHLIIRPEDITEVKSEQHVILQCMDVILGAMYFRLNDLHKEKLPGSYRRGKRTIAKHTLYKHINTRIRRIYPGFNIGISTGGTTADRWNHPYRHWLFTPKQYEIVPEYGKKKS